MTDPFSPDEERKLARRLAGEERPECPRCATPVDRRDVPPRRDVSYVRDRIWIVCPGCGGSCVLNRREVDRTEEE